MPADVGVGFVLVQHLDPTHDSLLADLLSKHTQLSVVQVSDGMRVEPNRIHVIPPNATLTISNNVLNLIAPVERRGMRMPIDLFFTSLAEDRRKHSVGIVLSGTGSDGSQGIRLIKACGGMVMVQDPAGAGYDGMPRSAIATGQVDHVLPVEEMPGVLDRYVRQPPSQDQDQGEAPKPSGQDADDLNPILALILAQQEYDFRYYRQDTLRRRIRRRMGLGHITRLEDYLDRLRRDSQEVQALIKDLLIGVTGFFREPAAWELMRERVLPELLRRHDGDGPLRIWVPGCATGEEAYSMAMLALEASEAVGRGNHLMIFATDIDKDALEVARSGRYPASLLADIAPERLARFFTQEGDNFQVKKVLREKVIVAAQNLVTDPPFSNLDLISCRNLLIYLKSDYQDRLIDLFHFALRDGGFLFLGSSETVGRREILFTPESSKWRIYRRIDTATPQRMAFPMVAEHQRLLTAHARTGKARRRAVKGYGPLTQRTLLDHFTPAAVLIDGQYRVLYYHGPVRNYLGPTPGDPSEDLLSLASEGLRGKLHTLLRQAVAEGRPVVVGSAHVRRGQRWYPTRVTVTPIQGEDGQGPLLLITFEDEHWVADEANFDRITQVRGEDVTLDTIEDELRSTREELRNSIEQMETTNEELKTSNEEVLSINEELQFTNEELETSKEELQSLNEELVTLNSQLEDKVHELEETNNDLGNLLISTDIATLFLDRRFRIRRYTPATTQLFRLIASDIGRTVTDITRRFEDPTLIADARRVLAGIQVEQQEIRSEDGLWFLRRMLPYRTDAEPIAGLVITFTDISTRKQAEIALKQSARALRRVTDAMPVLIAYIDNERCCQFNNAAYERWFDIRRESIRGRPVAEIVGDAAYRIIEPHLEQALAGEMREYEAWLPFQHGGARYVRVEYIPDCCDDGQVAGVFALVSDLSERRKAEEAIEQLHAENQARLTELQALFDAAPIGIFVGRDKDCRHMAMNRAGAQILRVAENVNPSRNGPDADSFPFRVFHQGRELRTEELPMQVAATTGEVIHDFEEEVLFPDGEIKTLMAYAAPLRDANGQVWGCVGTFADITAPKEAERRYREALERLNLHIDNTPVAAIEWDREHRVLRWSPADERLFGWSAKEALRQSSSELELVHGDDRERVAAVVAELVDGRVARNHSLQCNLCKNGNIIWCEWYNSVLRDERGGFVSLLSLALDVTDQQQLETDLRQQAEQLAEADRRKDEFLSMLGHELRNPLTPIRNAVQLMALQGENGISVEWARQVIDRQTRHLERLVDDLLDVARITRGTIRLQKQPIDLRAVLREALDATDVLMRERTHQIELNLPEQPVTVVGDSTRLVQVLANLLNNAARYTLQGGLIQVSLVRQKQTARITVEDNGRGIDPEVLPYIFDTFSQGQRSLARSEGGLGLGLTLVKQLVQMHGGVVEAQSSGADQGSRFVVIIPTCETPKAEADADEPPDTASAVQLPGNKKRILIVDDNPDIVETSTLLLQMLGHTVWSVSSGTAALRAVPDIRPDVVLLDIGLPDIDGIEVARHLAELPWRATMKIVGVSGYSEGIARAQGNGGLFDAHLLKPAALDSLKNILE